MAKVILPAESQVGGVQSRFSKKLNRHIWGYDIRVNGKRYRRYGFATKEEAEEFVKRYKFEEFKQKEKLIVGEPEMTKPPLPPVDKHCTMGSIGACAEMVVCVDLLRQGYDVFRSVSPNSECDLIISRRGKLCRIEVKSARRIRHRVDYSRKRLSKNKFDVLALVFLRNNSVVYQPSPAQFFEQFFKAPE